MNTQQSRPGDSNCRECEDRDNLTQKTITAERLKICATLYNTAGIVGEMEEKFDGERHIYYERKCMFAWTETNYRLYRNLDITIGTELTQTNESVKTNVANYNTLNKALNAQLKNIAKGVKDLRTKINELNEASCKLKHSTEEKCNAAQWKALTGYNSENNKDCNKPPVECKDAEQIFKDLYGKTFGGLLSDYESLFQSSYDVVGIQLFSNLETLDQLQKDLETFSKSFVTQVSNTSKTRGEDVKGSQAELTKSVGDLTKAAMDRNSSRSDFEGYKDAVEFLCCPVCGCVKETPDTGGEGNAGCKDGRLKRCEQEICCICEDVKKTFCCDNTLPPDEKNC
ncbi:MAG TPA: hypothetical protein VK618_12295 [Flavitalea sp.]|nr:hypothetical protein [Flavitalea sp.]